MNYSRTKKTLTLRLLLRCITPRCVIKS